ncbi:MFS transporter [Actinomadura alba]|uniref:MFS transporter n=1 Tax=Actinomadura alba TaxID=406431 RepID=A0ABR7LIX7_9ACTN|nr:MFS transporter [Actinomadura alba]MBC6464792.1 MFS transporter [Actinomadura alba]
MTVRRPPAPAATLAVLSLAQFLIALDYSIIYIALPSIAGELRLDPALAQWIVSAYAVLFAGFLVVGGRLTDRVGAGRMFIVAVIAFGAAGAIGGAAGDGTVLLAARGAQGLGAALLQPAVLGLIGTTFPAGPRRGRALAVWGSVGASGLAAGAILGGLLTTASWRLTFFVNVPLTLLCALGAAVWIGSQRDRTPAGRIPVLASVLGTGTVLTLALGLTLGADRGWRSALTLGCLGLALVLFLCFVRNERRSRNVLIEPVLRRTPSLRAGAAATALYMASVGSEFYLLTLLLQSAKGYPPLRAGLAFLPLALMVTAGSTAAGRAMRRFGAASVLVAGFVIATSGLLWLSLTLSGDTYAVDLLPGVLLSGFGHGVVYTSMFVIGTHDVPATHQGTAGALLTTSQYLSGALTVAVLTLALGPSPGHGNFRVAFLLTTAAAAAGAVLVMLWRGRLGTRPDAGSASGRVPRPGTRLGFRS